MTRLEEDADLLRRNSYPEPETVEWLDAVHLWLLLPAGRTADLYRIRFARDVAGRRPFDDFVWVIPTEGQIGRRPLSVLAPLGRALAWLALDEAAQLREETLHRLRESCGGIRSAITPCPKCGCRDAWAVRLPDPEDMETDRREGVRFGPIRCDALVPSTNAATGEPCGSECEADRGTLEEEAE